MSEFGIDATPSPPKESWDAAPHFPGETKGIGIGRLADRRMSFADSDVRSADTPRKGVFARKDVFDG